MADPTDSDILRAKLNQETAKADWKELQPFFARGQTVAVAGLASTGTPDSRATAAFSHRPQAGKLNALICTATPRRGVSRCRP